MRTIAVTTRKFLLKETLFQSFEGFDFVFNETSKTAEKDFFLQLREKNLIGVIAGTELYTPDILDLAPGLRTISRVGVGLDGLPQKELKSRGISFTSTPGAPTDSVAEFTVSQMLFLIRLATSANRPMMFSDQYQIGLSLHDLRVGILGAGKIGRRVLELLDSFRPKQLSWYDPYLSEPIASIHTPIIRAPSMDGLLAEADVLSLHLPLNEETAQIINERSVEILPKGAAIINCSRAGLIDEDALLRNLNNGKLSGAYLDVWQKNGPIRETHNKGAGLYISDHQASSTLNSRLMMERMSIANLEQSLREVGEV